MEVEKVVNRKKLAETIESFLELGMKLGQKDKFEQTDHAKLKLLRTMGSHVNAAIAMVQQETAQQRVAVIVERMKQLGYTVPKQLE